MGRSDAHPADASPPSGGSNDTTGTASPAGPAPTPPVPKKNQVTGPAKDMSLGLLELGFLCFPSG